MPAQPVKITKMDKQLPHITITIATYNAEKTVEEVLQSIQMQTYPQDKIEVIVVDDGSTDRTVEIVQQFTNILIEQENKGTANAHTRGLKEASGKYIFVLSHDSYAAVDWVERSVKSFKKDSHLGIVQGPVRKKPSHKGKQSEALFPSRNKGIIHCTTFKHFNRSFPTVAIAYKAEALDKVGRYFREDLSRYGDDSELAYRILGAGYEYKFLDKPIAYHEVLPELYWKEIKNAWGCYRFPLIFKLHPWARKYLKLGFLWGSKWRYLRMLLWPFAGLRSLISILVNRQNGVKISHQFLWDTVFTVSLIWGSIKYQSIVV